jgi:isoquinoline 1-oxidoreductase subunit alpha
MHILAAGDAPETPAMPYTININGVSRTVEVGGDTPLLWVLCDVIGMTGTKVG